jgi:hypothetical protein
MERSVIRGLVRGDEAPDFASLHPAYSYLDIHEDDQLDEAQQGARIKS